MEGAHASMCIISRDPSYKTAWKEWAIIGPLRCVILSTMQKGVMHISSMLNSFTSLQDHSIQL